MRAEKTFYDFSFLSYLDYGILVKHTYLNYDYDFLLVSDISTRIKIENFKGNLW